MNEHSLAVLLASSMLGIFLLAAAVIIAYWTRTGRIRRSPLATRREKNMRHLMTMATLGLAVVSSLIFMLIEPRIGGYLLLGAAIFALFIAPVRTIFIELGLRRMKTASPDATPPSSIDRN